MSAIEREKGGGVREKQEKERRERERGKEEGNAH